MHTASQSSKQGPGLSFFSGAGINLAPRSNDAWCSCSEESLSVLAWPLIAAAQPSAGMPGLAALFNGPEDVEKPNLVMLIRRLEEHGYAADRNIVLDVRYGNITGLPESSAN
jgi:hypothetical protein